MRKFFRSYYVKALLRDYRFYRKWYGGIWENWWLEDIHGFVWVQKTEDFYYSNTFQMLRRGTPLIELYPDKEILNA